MKNFDEIYSEYYDTVFRYILSLTRDRQWAEEITQESFFKALKSIGTFRGECKLSVWLCQIAKNIFYAEAKKKRWQAAEVPEEFSDKDDVERKICDRETAREIHANLHTLEEPYKEVFWMRTFGELSFKEIGTLFSKTESWARVTYHRAKMKIKEGIK